MQPRDITTVQLSELLTAIGSPGALRQMESTIFDGIAGGLSRVVLFGGGELGRWALNGVQKAGFEAVAFADNDATLWGRSVHGVRVVPPSDAVAAYNDDAFFLVAVYNSSAPRQQLQALGCTRVVPYPAFFWRFPESLPEERRLELPHRIIAAAEEINRGYECLHDDASRAEFRAQIAWRCSLNYSELPPANPAREIYFPGDLISLTREEALVDCGAFDGDSIRLFLERTKSFRHIYAIEPDAANRRALESYRASLSGEYSDRISILPFGVGDRDETVFFDAHGTAASKITSAESAQSIVCRRLDGLITEPSPTIIKMDIEGAEPDALRGATELIRRSRPILAICAYHACEHLWTLPQIIRTLVPEYQIYLRRYAEECWETVYYAIPPERSASTFQNR